MTKHKINAAIDRNVARVIGTIESNPNGRQVVFFAGIHGNEPAGITALKKVLDKIQQEQIPFHGKLWALKGNLPALEAKRRFIDKDLNRIWYTPNNDSPPLSTEYVEVQERIALEKYLMEIISISRDKIYFFDLHTTSAHGIPFVSISDTLRNRKLVDGIPVPIILGLEEEMEGTLFNFFNELGISMVLFEGGQHDSAAAVDNHEAFIWLVLARLGFIRPEDFHALHTYREILGAEGIFEKHVFEIKYRHALNGSNGFAMVPGFVNFQTIRKNQILAYDNGGAVRSPVDGRIFMPLYQEQGLDGFFIIREIRLFWLRISELIRRFEIDNYLNILPGIKKHSENNTYIVNPRIARFFTLPIFHLLGYRKVIRHDNKLIVKRRPYDNNQPPIDEIKKRYFEISGNGIAK